MAGRRPPRSAGEGLLRPTPRPEGVLALDDVIAALGELDANGLCLQWRNHLGGTASIVEAIHNVGNRSFVALEEQRRSDGHYFQSLHDLAPNFVWNENLGSGAH